MRFSPVPGDADALGQGSHFEDQGSQYTARSRWDIVRLIKKHNHSTGADIFTSNMSVVKKSKVQKKSVYVYPTKCNSYTAKLGKSICLSVKAQNLLAGYPRNR